ncbi:MAG: hypothetical protein JWN53_2239 [Gemmatimonadetes bacterium]|nr:hypothetical protein [Gemmatimonadota bacterium]
MHITTTVVVAALLVAAPAAGAQRTRSEGDDTVRSARAAGAADPRAMFGITLALSGNERDTLGALVSGVVRNSPADKSGIDQGNRIVVINGTEIRTDPADVGRDGDDALQRRIVKALRGVHAGDEVALRVYSGSRTRMVNVAALVDGPAAEPRVVSQGRARTGDEAGITATTTAPATTAATVLDGLRATRMQLRRLELEAGTGPTADSLDLIDDELGVIQRRLRAIQSSAPHAAAAPAPAPAIDNTTLSGMRLSPVTSDLAAYFGEDSEGGLLVLDVDASWAPIRKGDVLLRVEGQPVTIPRLRDALTQGQRVEVLRRARTITITLHAKE